MKLDVYFELQQNRSAFAWTAREKTHRATYKTGLILVCSFLVGNEMDTCAVFHI